MKIYLAGGESITRERHKAMFEAGCKRRLVSFYSGEGPIRRVVEAAKEAETNSQNTEKT